jgi:hypothetical protein
MGRNPAIRTEDRAIKGMEDKIEKESEKEDSTRNNFKGRKWGVRILIIFLIYAVIYLVSQFTLHAKYPNILISLFTGLFLILLVFGILIRATRKMFTENYLQYGFYLIIFAYFTLYGNFTYNRVTADLFAYYETPEFIERTQVEILEYYQQNPTIDTLSAAVSDSIALSLVKKDSKAYSMVTRAWEHKLMGSSSSFPSIVLFIVYVVSFVRLKIENFRIRRKWNKSHGLD